MPAIDVKKAAGKLYKEITENTCAVDSRYSLFFVFFQTVRRTKTMMQVVMNLLLVPACALGYLGWAVRTLKD